MQRSTRNQIAHSDKEHRNCENNADPEASPHIDEFRILVLGKRDRSRLERHSANWATTRRVPYDLRMHRTGVFDLLFRCLDDFWFEPHPTLRAGTVTRLPDFRMHRTGEGGGGFTSANRNGLKAWRSFKRGLKIRLRVLAKLVQAVFGAKVVSLTVVFERPGCRRGVYDHATNWINGCWGLRFF